MTVLALGLIVFGLSVWLCWELFVNTLPQPPEGYRRTGRGDE